MREIERATEGKIRGGVLRVLRLRKGGGGIKGAKKGKRSREGTSDLSWKLGENKRKSGKTIEGRASFGGGRKKLWGGERQEKQRGNQEEQRQRKWGKLLLKGKN